MFFLYVLDSVFCADYEYESIISQKSFLNQVLSWKSKRKHVICLKLPQKVFFNRFWPLFLNLDPKIPLERILDIWKKICIKNWHLWLRAPYIIMALDKFLIFKIIIFEIFGIDFVHIKMNCRYLIESWVGL